MKRNEAYLKHILDAIEKIENYIGGMSLEEFLKDSLKQDGVIRELEIIGEAAKKLSQDFKDKTSNIPWRKIMGMRDKLIHDYFDVDKEAVWKTATEDIIFLKKELQEAEE